MAQESRGAGNAVEHGQVEVAGARVEHFAAGSGDPVLMLDVGQWRNGPLVDGLAQAHHVVSLSFPEMSFAKRPESLRDFASLLNLAARELTPGKYTLIGESAGAGVALWQTLLAPDDIQALVLISPTTVLPIDDPLGARPAQLLAHPENDAALLPMEPAVANGMKSLLRTSSHDTELEERLGEISCATLTVFGLNDRMVAPEAARVYREKIPNCNISLVYDAGHAIVADRPEALTSLVSDFVERRETFIVGRESGLINP